MDNCDKHLGCHILTAMSSKNVRSVGRHAAMVTATNVKIDALCS
jgi:hypothetical protein